MKGQSVRQDNTERSYIVKFLIEATGVTDRPSLRSSPPERGGLSQAVVAAQTFPPAGALQGRNDNKEPHRAGLTTRQFLGLTRGRLVPFIL